MAITHIKRLPHFWRRYVPLVDTAMFVNSDSHKRAEYHKTDLCCLSTQTLVKG